MMAHKTAENIANRIRYTISRHWMSEVCGYQNYVTVDGDKITVDFGNNLHDSNTIFVAIPYFFDGIIIKSHNYTAPDKYDPRGGQRAADLHYAYNLIHNSFEYSSEISDYRLDCLINILMS